MTWRSGLAAAVVMFAVIALGPVSAQAGESRCGTIPDRDAGLRPDTQCLLVSASGFSLEAEIERILRPTTNGVHARPRLQLTPQGPRTTSTLRKCTSPRKGMIIGAVLGAAGGIAAVAYIQSGTIAPANGAIWTGFIAGGAGVGAFVGHELCS